MTIQTAANKLRVLLDVSEEAESVHEETTTWDGNSTTRTTSESAGGEPPDEEPKTIGTTETEPLPKDVSFDILKNRRRRLVLAYILDHETPVTIGTLAEHVASIENEKDVAVLNSRERKRAYVGLYQCHLPRMHDAGVIDFDQNRGTVSLGVHAEELEPFLSDPTDATDNYPWLYTAVSMVGAGAFLISQSTVFGATAIGTFVVGLVLATILAAASWQLYDSQRDSDEEFTRGLLQPIPFLGEPSPADDQLAD